MYTYGGSLSKKRQQTTEKLKNQQPFTSAGSLLETQPCKKTSIVSQETYLTQAFHQLAEQENQVSHFT